MADENLTGEARAAKEIELQDQESFLSDNLLPDRFNVEADQGELMPYDILKKYLIYAKRHFRPKLAKIDQDKVTQFYAEIRRESSVVGGIPIAVRHIESLIRMSEAHAKVHLRDEVTTADIDVAIELLLDSFIQSQKHSVGRQLIKKFEKYRKRTNDTSYLLLHLLQNLVRQRAQYNRVVQGVEDEEKIHVKVPLQQFENEARDYDRSNLISFYGD